MSSLCWRWYCLFDANNILHFLCHPVSVESYVMKNSNILAACVDASAGYVGISNSLVEMLFTHMFYFSGKPIEQYYELTQLKKSNVRMNDQLWVWF